MRLAIEGEDAISATEALLASPEISGTWELSSESSEREGVAATVATIVGIVGGMIAIAEQIRKWYQEYKQKGKKIDKVIIVGRNGRRLLLEDTTVEEIRKVLDN
ncbi:hypothetical protein WA1_25220 [Scytonema hofmannii PCC 7110]|uniref:Uncharacterized protein n=1 Tax=Scytonema hofmannii PCC 7110 TaxID=128403 RepID=A0A139X8F9_9CYAN|nr:hypothetical protein WA1_25220 [Scytonema hofmannii PCC 7110]